MTQQHIWPYDLAKPLFQITFDKSPLYPKRVPFYADKAIRGRCLMRDVPDGMRWLGVRDTERHVVREIVYDPLMSLELQICNK